MRNSCPIRSTRHYRSLSAKDGSRAYVGNRSSELSPPDPSIDSFSNPFESDGFISYLSRFVAKNRSFIYLFVSLERELFIRESRSQRVLPRYDPATRFQLNAPYRGNGAQARYLEGRARRSRMSINVGVRAIINTRRVICSHDPRFSRNVSKHRS